MVLKLGDISIHSWQSYNVCILKLLFVLFKRLLNEVWLAEVWKICVIVVSLLAVNPASCDPNCVINHCLDEKTHFLWIETNSVIKKELLEVLSVLEINKNRIWASHYGKEENQLYTGRGNLFYLTDLDYCYLRRL